MKEPDNVTPLDDNLIDFLQTVGQALSRIPQMLIYLMMMTAVGYSKFQPNDVRSIEHLRCQYLLSGRID